MAEYSKSLGDCIYKRRKQLRMTQAELAESIGVTEQTIRKIEHYRANPQMDVLYSLVRTLQIDPAEIFYPKKEIDGSAHRRLLNLLSDIGDEEAEELIPITEAVLKILRKTAK